MPVSCCIPGCKSISRKDSVSFFRIPSVFKFWANYLNPLREKRREAWLNAIGKDFSENQFKYLRVCSKHFLSGKPASLMNEDDPDWVPSINMGYNASESQPMQPMFLNDPNNSVTPIAKDSRMLPCKNIRFGCSVPICKYKSLQKNVLYYKFPTHNAVLCALWEASLHLLNSDRTNLFVCEQHFAETDFIPGTLYLKKLAVPSYKPKDMKLDAELEEKENECRCKCYCGKKRRQVKRNNTEYVISFCKPNSTNCQNVQKPTSNVSKIFYNSPNPAILQDILSENVSTFQNVLEVSKSTSKQNNIITNVQNVQKSTTKVAEVLVGTSKQKTPNTNTQKSIPDVLGIDVTEVPDRNSKQKTVPSDDKVESDDREETLDASSILVENYLKQKKALFEGMNEGIQFTPCLSTQSGERKLKEFCSKHGAFCPYCHFKYTTVSGLIEHVKNIHTKGSSVGIFVNEVIVNPSATANANVKVINDILEKMEELQKDFPYFYETMNYEKICQYCEEKFYSISALIQHVKSVHTPLFGPQPLTDKQLKEGMRNCRYCNKITNTKEEFQEHIKFCLENPNGRGQNEKQLMCSYCGQLFGRYCLKKHIATIHEDQGKRFVCELCGLAIRNQNNYKMHKLRHENKRTYKCSVEGCNRMFNTPKCVRRHINVVHSDSSKWSYTCSYCHRRFAVKQNMLLHEETHSNTTETCGECPKVFKGKLSLHLHKIREHSNIRKRRSWVAQGGGTRTYEVSDQPQKVRNKSKSEGAKRKKVQDNSEPEFKQNPNKKKKVHQQVEYDSSTSEEIYTKAKKAVQKPSKTKTQKDENKSSSSDEISHMLEDNIADDEYFSDFLNADIDSDENVISDEEIANLFEATDSDTEESE